jgi:hypothetical protein
MGSHGYLDPPNTESEFHRFDRLERENRALRALHGPLDTDAGRPPTGVPARRLREENDRIRAALAKRGVSLPEVPAGSVQPTDRLPDARRHLLDEEAAAAACIQCGRPRSPRVCACGYVFSPAGRAPVRMIEDPPDPSWDRFLAGLAVVPAVLAGLLWLLQPLFR